MTLSLEPGESTEKYQSVAQTHTKTQTHKHIHTPPQVVLFYYKAILVFLIMKHVFLLFAVCMSKEHSIQKQT